MTPTATLTIVLLAAAIALCAVAAWALREVGLSARSARSLADETRERLVPLLDKADVTVDAVNAELLRVDLIITRFEEASERVSQASATVQDLANAPERIATGVAERVRSWRDRRRAETPADSEQGTAPDGGDETAVETPVSAEYDAEADQAARAIDEFEGSPVDGSLDAQESLLAEEDSRDPDE